MNNIYSGINMSQDDITEQRQSGLNPRQLIHVIYGLFALGILSAGIFGVAIIASIVLAYIKRSDLVGTVYASHLDWIIKTFWWGLLWFILSLIASLFFIGYLTGLIVIIWVVYRIAKGWLAHFAGETPMPGI